MAHTEVDRDRHGREVMHQNSISYLARMGYSDGLIGISPVFIGSKRYMNAYDKGAAQWAMYIAMARGEA